jgi:hypothetical protein
MVHHCSLKSFGGGNGFGMQNLITDGKPNGPPRLFKLSAAERLTFAIGDFEDVEVGIFNIHRPREFASADNPEINEGPGVQVTRADNVARLVECTNRRPWLDIVETCIP